MKRRRGTNYIVRNRITTTNFTEKNHPKHPPKLPKQLLRDFFLLAFRLTVLTEETPINLAISESHFDGCVSGN